MLGKCGCGPAHQDEKGNQDHYKCQSCGSTSKESAECCGGAREKTCSCGSDKNSKDCCGA